MSEMAVTYVTKVHFQTGRRGRKRLEVGLAPPPPPASKGRVPRVARVIALALRFDELLRQREVKNLAEIARLGQVTRARVTQVMGLLALAPDIVEELLHLPPTTKGRHPIAEWMVRPIAAEPLWRKQRILWAKLKCSLTASQTE